MAALLALGWCAGVARGASLEHIQVLSEPGRARVVLQIDGEPASADVRANPAVGAVPARDVLTLAGTQPGAEVLASMVVAERGLQTIHVTPVGTSLQLTVDVDESRTPTFHRLTDGWFVFDLVAADAPSSSQLPTDDQLRASLAAKPSARPVVVVDAGHGGWDHGAIGLTGTREADVALQIARKVAARLKDEGAVDVIMTRDSDVFVSLEDRARIANDRHASLFVSIHANAAPGPTAWGIETYSLDTASDAGAARVASRENALLREGTVDQELQGRLMVEGTNLLSHELAREVQAHLLTELRPLYGDLAIRDLGTKTALFYVLAATRMPAILVETSFLTEPKDERRLRTAHFQDASAQAITDGVDRWLERQGEGHPPSR